MGQRLNIIIVAEGAIDTKGNKITPDGIKSVSLTSSSPRDVMHVSTPQPT